MFPMQYTWKACMHSKWIVGSFGRSSHGEMQMLHIPSPGMSMKLNAQVKDANKGIRSRKAKSTVLSQNGYGWFRIYLFRTGISWTYDRSHLHSQRTFDWLAGYPPVNKCNLRQIETLRCDFCLRNVITRDASKTICYFVL